jgi:SOS-response transcriptional repressor LexA
MARKKKQPGQSKNEVLGLSVNMSTKEWVESVADKAERSLSYVAGALFERGRAAYERDGLLKEPEDGRSYGVPLKIVGRVSGGKPIETIEDVEEILVLSTDIEGVKKPRALRVVGDSMRHANVMDGDIILVGDCESPINRIVVALITDRGTVDATLKMWRQKGQTVTLESANPDYEPITLPAKKVRWYGMLIKVLRTFPIGNMNEQAEADAA